MYCLMFMFMDAARQQFISFYRFSSCMYAPVLCLSLLLCALLPNWKGWRAAAFTVLFLGATCAGELFHGQLDRRVRLLDSVGKQSTTERASAFAEEIGTRKKRASDLKSIVVNSTRLMRGKYSLQDAYQNQQGWPGRMPWGGIYPAMATVRQIVGPDVPIYSFHCHDYSMAPDSDVRRICSSPTPLDSILLGSADQAREAFEAQGVRYFFVSKELQMRSLLHHSPLFAPEEIGRHMGVCWTDGTSYLLTWAGADTVPLDDTFLASYTKQTAESPMMNSFELDELRAVFTDLKQNGLKPRRLPWHHRGWRHP
jgi:hypothetical protein